MTIPLFLFFIHVLALCGFVILFFSAPCWMQKMVVVGMAASMGLIASGYYIDLVTFIDKDSMWWGARYFIQVGYVIEHIAVLLYVFRLLHQNEKAKWQKSLQPFQISRH